MSTRIAIFGSSYVHHLKTYTSGDMKVPATVRFFGLGGMRADRVDEGLLQEMLRFEPHFVFVTLGGNDIGSRSSPKEIAKTLGGLVETIKDNGAKEVYFTEIMERGKFKKDPLLTKKSFNAQRNKINELMARTCRTIKLPVRFPKHYTSDDVHLNKKGNRKFYYGLKTVMFSLK